MRTGRFDTYVATDSRWERLWELLGFHQFKREENCQHRMACAHRTGTWTHAVRMVIQAPNKHQHSPAAHPTLVSPLRLSSARAADGSCHHDHGRGHPLVRSLAPALGH